MCWQAKAVIATGKPVALVSINGGLISLDELTTQAPAILLAWCVAIDLMAECMCCRTMSFAPFLTLHPVFGTVCVIYSRMPGAHGAQAVADAIFGAYNPGGKMPATMYNSSYINSVDFLDMSMQAGPGRS